MYFSAAHPHLHGYVAAWEEVTVPFIKDVVSVTQISEVDWRLNEPIVYEGRAQTFTVPADSETDFASVPRIFVWLVPTYGVYTKAAIVHDFLCRTAPIPRVDADGIFRRCLRELEVPFVRRWIMWAAVRLGAKLSGTTLRELALWLLVAVPAFTLLLIPGLVVLAGLGVFWLLELLTSTPSQDRARLRRAPRQCPEPSDP